MLTVFVILCAYSVYYVFACAINRRRSSSDRNLSTITIVLAYGSGILTGNILKNKPFSDVVVHILLPAIVFYIAISAINAIGERYRRSRASAPPER